MRKVFRKNWLVVMALAMLSACSGAKKEQVEAQAPSAEEKPKVILAEVKEEAVSQIESFTATVEAEVKNNISPSTPVRIEKIFVEVGDKVKKGQKLVQMDNVNLKTLETQLKNQTIEFDRVDELYKVGGASKSEWDAKKMSVDITRNSYDNMVINTTLGSPIDGIVTARNYDNGDMFGANPILTIQKISPVKLKINVSESLYTKITKGMAVSVKLDVYGDEEFEGRVHLIYPTIDPNTRTFEVEVTIENREQRVRPGMFARVEMNLGTVNRVVIPDLAIIKQQGSGERYVFVCKDGRVYHTPVQLGRRMGDRFELISGVASNSKVVVAGQARLKDDVEVEVTQQK